MICILLLKLWCIDNVAFAVTILKGLPFMDASRRVGLVLDQDATVREVDLDSAIGEPDQDCLIFDLLQLLDEYHLIGSQVHRFHFFGALIRGCPPLVYTFLELQEIARHSISHNSILEFSLKPSKEAELFEKASW